MIEQDFAPNVQAHLHTQALLELELQHDAGFGTARKCNEGFSEDYDLPNSAVSLAITPQTVTAILYYAWANRDNYDMQAWLPIRIEHVKINS